MKEIICISGKARAGKDTVGEMLKSALESKGEKVLVTHYADLLKYICKSFFGWDGNKDEYGRGLLQRIGSDVIRAKNPNFWVNFIADMISYFYDEWDYVIIPDCRFPNEISVLRSRFPHHVIHIDVVRPNFENGLTEEQKNHPSENSMNMVSPNHRFINEGSLETLNKYVRAFVQVVLV